MSISHEKNVDLFREKLHMYPTWVAMIYLCCVTHFLRRKSWPSLHGISPSRVSVFADLCHPQEGTEANICN